MRHFVRKGGVTLKCVTSKLYMIVGALLLLSGCGLLPEEEEALEPPLVEPSSTQYETETVERGELVDAFEARASFESDEEVDVKSSEDGQDVEEIHVKSNDTVEKGETLVDLEVGDLPLDIRQQELSVSQAELSLNTAQENIDENNQLKTDVENLKNERGEKKQKLDDLKNGLKETEDPEKENEISVNIEELQADIDQTKAKIDEKDGQIQKGSELNQEVESADIELEREQNSLDDLQEKLSAATVTAPIPGIVTSFSDIKEGQTLEPETTIATISDPDSLRLETSDDRNKWDDIKKGMDVDVAIGKEKLEGEVREIPDSDDGDESLIIDVEDIPESADLGERADIRIVFEKRKDVLTVPAGAIRNYDEQSVVRILDDDDLSEVSVEQGLEVDDKVEILSGLEEGDEVVLR